MLFAFMLCGRRINTAANFDYIKRADQLRNDLWKTENNAFRWRLEVNFSWGKFCAHAIIFVQDFVTQRA
jgi:hypothetical protein